MCQKLYRFILVGILVAGVGGCGKKKYDVTGKVTYNGAPLSKPDGQIVFVGPAGEQVPAALGPDGDYHATGVAEGLNKIAVYYPNPKAAKKSRTKLRPGETPPPIIPPFLTPAKYATPDTSELSISVEQESTFSTDLKGPKIP